MFSESSHTSPLKNFFLFCDGSGAEYDWRTFTKTVTVSNTGADGTNCKILKIKQRSPPNTFFVLIIKLTTIIYCYVGLGLVFCSKGNSIAKKHMSNINWAILSFCNFFRGLFIYLFTHVLETANAFKGQLLCGFYFFFVDSEVQITWLWCIMYLRKSLCSKEKINSKAPGAALIPFYISR